MAIHSLSFYDARGGGSEPLISRFTIAVLSSLLTGMSIGYALSQEARLLTAAAAVLGFLFYGYRTWLVHREYKAHCNDHRGKVEQRLIEFSPHGMSNGHSE